MTKADSCDHMTSLTPPTLNYNLVMFLDLESEAQETECHWVWMTGVSRQEPSPSLTRLVLSQRGQSAEIIGKWGLVWLFF